VVHFSAFIDQEGRVQEYVKGALLMEQNINDVVTRIQKQEPVHAVPLH